MDNSQLIQCRICSQFYIRRTLHNCPPKRVREDFVTCQVCGKENVHPTRHLCESPIEQYIDDGLEGDALLQLFLVRYLREIGIPRSRILFSARSNRNLVEISRDLIQFPPAIQILSEHNQATFVEAQYLRSEQFRNALNQRLREFLLNSI